MSMESMEQNTMAPAWINKELVQKALQVGDGDPNTSVLSLNISMANAFGDGNASEMYRIVAKLQNSVQRRVIIKCEPRGGTREELIKNSGVFQRETKMFTETLPAMYRLLEDAKPGSYPPFGAKCLYHGNDPVQFLVLEDLRQSGFTLTGRQKCLDLAQCIIALKTIARFHASSLALVQKDPTAVCGYENSFYNEKLRHELAPFFQNTLQSLENIVSEWPGFEKYSGKISKIRENVYDLIVKEFKEKYDLNTLIHGDLWSGNMMFKYDGSLVTDYRLLDFQVCVYSSPTSDLQHFLNNCPNAEVRESNVEELIQEYHRTFSETLDLLHCPTFKMTLDELKTDLDKHMLYGFIIAGAYLPLTLSNPQSEKWDMNDLLDQKETNSRFWERTMRSENYKRIMKKLLVKCENLGVF